MPSSRPLLPKVRLQTLKLPWLLHVGRCRKPLPGPPRHQLCHLLPAKPPLLQQRLSHSTAFRHLWQQRQQGLTPASHYDFINGNAPAVSCSLWCAYQPPIHMISCHRTSCKFQCGADQQLVQLLHDRRKLCRQLTKLIHSGTCQPSRPAEPFTLARAFRKTV